MNTPGQPHDVVLLVDIANVMGSRPDGWWRDRAAAATRLLIALEPLNGAEITVPGSWGWCGLRRSVRSWKVQPSAPRGRRL